ncbi:SDR family oxidoreductase [Saccharopolyspora mangrovi]|uniref:SDR family oxidoreductase n=1 Tax=Saccharopolyspora mangrovi TaxID=3082379 RepID=A0ABU6A838_9PSEU|nr:SDR family oxidoreductase [Saccharopolyspora sp. S2-29]MEB3367623.1 SDR family oxidoreductase [Saccharopolyspora sp. S2-29]
MSIVVTGATGKLGLLVVEGLLRKVPADEVAAVVRDAAKAAPLAARGVELRIADYDTPDTFSEAFNDGDVVLLVSSPDAGRRVPQHRAVIDAAKEAGVARLVYTGVLGGPEANFALAEDHKGTEQAILDSGLPWTFLRNGWYSENYTEQIPTQLEHGVVGSAGDGKIGSAAREDYAEAAVAVLTEPGHENRSYELSGDQAWTLPEYAEELSRQSGTEVSYTDVPPDTLKGILTGAGVPEAFADILVDVDTSAIAQGLLEGGSGDLARLIGRPTTPIARSISAALER